MLENIPDIPQVKSCSGKVRVVFHREEDELHIGKKMLQLLSRVETIQRRHANVQYDEVRLEFRGLDQQFSAVPHNSNHVTALLQYRTETLCNDCVVVSNEDPRQSVSAAEVSHRILPYCRPRVGD